MGIKAVVNALAPVESNSPEAMIVNTFPAVGEFKFTVAKTESVPGFINLKK